MAALGQRDDWEDLTVDGALITTGTELFNRDGVRYRSGFFGPTSVSCDTIAGLAESSETRKRLPSRT